LNVKTTGSSSTALGSSNNRLMPWVFASSVLVGWVLVTGGSRNKRGGLRYGLLPLSLLLILLCSCGGSGGSRGGTTSGSYTLMVTAKVGSKSEQLPLTLIVQ
jgi:hypothetical protein